MEVKLDTSRLLAQLQAFEKEATRRMERMVQGFAYQLTIQASSNTPLGDTNAWMTWYQERQTNTGLLPQEGLARGNWQFSKDAVFTLQSNYGVNSDDAAADKVRVQSVAYKLGETFYIGNSAPYISALENDYSNQTNSMGIIKPTMSQITGAYAVNLQYYYKKG
jgi:hypothetical protein